MYDSYLCSSPYQSSGTTDWVDSTRHQNYLAASPGGENNIHWFPQGWVAQGASLTGTIWADNAGVYSFGTFSDDGSALYVDNQLVVNHGWDHGPTNKFENYFLSAGSHTIYVTYYQNGYGEDNLTAYIDDRLKTVAPVPDGGSTIALFGSICGLFGFLRRKF